MAAPALALRLRPALKNGGRLGFVSPKLRAMNLSNSPRPPKWPYFVGDAFLLALACLVPALAETPLSALALSVIFGCVALGAILGATPYLLDFLAAQRTAEAEFQQRLEVQNHKLVQAVETLASTSAQLKSAHEAAANAVHAADTLPYRLQEKIAEFTNQLQERDDEDKAAMTKELEALRDAEGQRLSALATTIQSATKEFAAIEKDARAALEAARREATEAAPALAAALGAATTRAEAALGAAAHRAESSLNQSAANAQTAIGTAEARARETLAAAEAVSGHLLERTAALRQLEQEIDASLNQRIDQLHAAARAIEAAGRATRRPRAAAGDHAEAAAEAVPADSSAPDSSTATAALPVMQLTAFPRIKRDPIAPRSAESPAETAEAAPISSTTGAPAAASQATEPAEPAGSADPATTATQTEPAPEATLAAEPPPKREPRRKSSTRSLGEAVLPGFAEPEIIYDAEPASHSAPAKTNDGTTRLLVTAYIGIGNKVFIRGEGPGLSWEKGVPMEFISIGKWSWKTPDATAPVKIQLYKNDDIAAQGEAILLPPGHHVEATPVFREPDPF